jgi:hypothetical protein
MSTLTPTRLPVPAPRPAPRPNPYPRPDRPIVAAAPCGGCGFTFCRCPRKGWGITTAAAGPAVRPGKSTRPPVGGGVHPPRPGWGGKGR